jgi:hypothetical protein
VALGAVNTTSRHRTPMCLSRCDADVDTGCSVTPDADLLIDSALPLGDYS